MLHYTQSFDSLQSKTIDFATSIKKNMSIYSNFSAHWNFCMTSDLQASMLFSPYSQPSAFALKSEAQRSSGMWETGQAILGNDLQLPKLAPPSNPVCGPLLPLCFSLRPPPTSLNGRLQQQDMQQQQQLPIAAFIFVSVTFTSVSFKLLQKSIANHKDRPSVL